MKISFIIPVYKVEKYLDDCVQSIVSQSYRNIEVLLVDDGSPDSCPALCDGWANADPRIKAFHKFNGGLSDARNYGLQKATGDYVIFVDSDDFWIGNDSLQKLVLLIERYPECDFYSFNCQYYFPNSRTFRKWVSYSSVLKNPIDGSNALCLLISSGTLPMSANLKIIKRKWLLDTGISFKVNQISEDVPWFINLLDRCKKCIFVNDYVYAYRQNVAGSITANFNEKSFNSLLEIIKNELLLIDKRSFNQDAKDSLKSFLAYELSILMSGISKLPKEKKYIARSEVKSLCWLFKYTQNPKVYLISLVYKAFGYLFTEYLLMIYNWYRIKRSE